MIWTKDRPRLTEAWYWRRPKNSTNDKAVAVYISKNGTYKNGTYEIFDDEGVWSHCPIPYPEESKVEDC